MKRVVRALAAPLPVSMTDAGWPEIRPAAWQQSSAQLVSRADAVIALAYVLATVLHYEGFEALRAVVIGLALLICAATDALAYRVPNAVTLPATAFALLASLFGSEPPLTSALTAAVLAGGLLLMAAVLTRGGLGGGDVKLGLLIGAALGVPTAALALATGILLGGLVIVALYLTRHLGRHQAFPFAPFLSLSALGFLLAG